MECSLYALLACFSWTNFYVDGGLSWQDRGELRVFQYGTFDPEPLDGISEARPYVFTTDEAENLYGDFGLGYNIMPTKSLEISLSLRTHKSSISTGEDHGINYARLGFKWFPMKR